MIFLIAIYQVTRDDNDMTSSLLPVLWFNNCVSLMRSQRRYANRNFQRQFDYHNYDLI